MTAKPSTYPVTKARLYSILAATEGLEGLVHYGEPSGMPVEFVAVLSTPIDSDEQWASLGGEHREERYEIELAVGAATKGNTQQQATERCEDLWELVTVALRGWPRGDQTAATAGVFAAQIVRTRRVERIIPEGRAAGTTGAIQVQARI